MKVSKLLPLIGILIFLYLLATIDLGQVTTMLLAANPFYFGAAVGLTFLIIMLKAFKWQLIFNTYHLSLPFRRFLPPWIIGLSLSMITPGKVGDFAKATYLSDKAPLGKGITSVMADRIIDLLTLFILTIIGLSYFATTYAQNTSLLLTTYLLFAIFIIAVLLLSKQRIASLILRPFYIRFLPQKMKEKVRSVYSDFYSGIGVILGRKRIIITVSILTFIVWLSNTLVLYLLALSLGFQIPYEFLLIVFPIITLLEALPISFSGVGTRDAAMVFFFSFIALGAEVSVGVSLLFLFTSYVFVFIGFILWYRNPIHLKDLTS